jgi:HEAT repeat protein
MNQTTRTYLDLVRSPDKALQNQAFTFLIEATEKPVDWAYEAWDEILEGLGHKDNHVRAISAQLLCNLAKSDPLLRMMKDFDALFDVTRDKRFVTARHTMQSLWKVGAAGELQRSLLLDGLERRFYECATEKNCTLIRYDIQQSLYNVYAQTGDEKVRQKALELIELEEDAKYKKKYQGVWKEKRERVTQDG